MKKILSSLRSLLLPSPPTWQIVYYGKYRPLDVDYTILDLFGYSPKEIDRASYPIAYLSAHYEDWRPDAHQFGKLLHPILNWDGEQYIQWDDPDNQRVMVNRLRLAKEKGFRGVDLDNIDGPGTVPYFRWLIDHAKNLGLSVTMKNATEHLPIFGSEVDFFVSEAVKLSELTCYRKYNKPTVRMYYNGGSPTPRYIYEISNSPTNRF